MNNNVICRMCQFLQNRFVNDIVTLTHQNIGDKIIEKYDCKTLVAPKLHTAMTRLISAAKRAIACAQQDACCVCRWRCEEKYF